MCPADVTPGRKQRFRSVIYSLVLSPVVVSCPHLSSLLKFCSSVGSPVPPEIKGLAHIRECLQPEVNTWQ